MKTFFTSDTHFGSERTRQLSQRPFSSTTEMDQTIITNWNKLVSKDDVVYHLGDFGDYNNISRLNGKVILILGNYETEDLLKNYSNNFSELKKYLLNLGFADVIKHGLYLNDDLLGWSFYLTHKPTDCKKDMFNLFGHIHKLCMVKKFGLNVGIDNFYFSPATIENVLFYKNAIEKHYDKDVFLEISDLK